jgi:hypothetical protein
VTKLTALLLSLSLTLLLSAGCAVGPNYKRPSTDFPGMYRGTTPQDAAQPAPESLGDQNFLVPVTFSVVERVSHLFGKGEAVTLDSTQLPELEIEEDRA